MTTTNKRSAASPRNEGTPGAAVDAVGRPVLDPTANVLALVKAANERRDDLSTLGALLTEAQIRRVEDLEVKDIRYALAAIKTNAAHVKELSDIRAAYDEKLRTVTTTSIESLTARVGPLEKIVAETAAKGVGVATAWGVLIGAVSLIATLILIGLFVFNGRTATPAPTPQVYYAPAAPGTMIPSSPVQPQR